MVALPILKQQISHQFYKRSLDVTERECLQIHNEGTYTMNGGNGEARTFSVPHGVTSFVYDDYFGNMRRGQTYLS